jgi:hypothetical protein
VADFTEGLAAVAVNGKWGYIDRRGTFVVRPMFALYFSGRRHAGENLADLLSKRPEGLSPPIRMADASSANRVGGVAAIEAGCWAHARRKFVEIEGDFPTECAHTCSSVVQRRRAAPVNLFVRRHVRTG